VPAIERLAQTTEELGTQPGQQFHYRRRDVIPVEHVQVRTPGFLAKNQAVLDQTLEGRRDGR